MRSIPFQEKRLGEPLRTNSKRGATSLILGCMFSGKTTELIARVERFPAGSVLAVKHAIDTRFGRDAIISHAGKALAATPVTAARDILDLVADSTRMVAIDEGHFFDLGLMETIEAMNGRGLDVVVASLEPDSWGLPFPINDNLRRQAAECVWRMAVCARCRGIADRTQRLTPIVGGNMVVNPAQYEPRCQTCWRPPIIA